MTDNRPAEKRERTDGAAVEPSPPAGPAEQEVVRGRRPETPFLLLGGVMLTVWTVAALVALGLLLLWWLA